MFRDMKQQTQFAFNLAQYDKGTGSRLTLVRMALAQTCVKLDDPDPDQLAATARHTMNALRSDLLGYERASLIAAFSRDWEERRAAVAELFPFFRVQIARLVDDKELIDKLVRRHYKPVRERGPTWELAAISEQYKAARDRVARASQLVDKLARQLEAAALERLEHLLQREVAHA